MTAAPPTDRPDLQMGRAAADAIVWASLWRHRKVESVRLLEGKRGRRRISIDCTPPPEPALAYDFAERVHGSIEQVQGPVMVPIAMIHKDPMRDLDVTDGPGSSLPVLGSKENGLVAWAALCSLYGDSLGRTIPGQLTDTLHAIVHGSPVEATASAEALLDTGFVGSVKVFDTGQVDDMTRRLTLDLALNFLLVVLVPAAAAGNRQIIKYSFHWRSVLVDLSWLKRIGAALGLSGFPYLIEVNGASDTASYHLEVHAPPELTCAGLTLPAGPPGTVTSTPDSTVDVVAHAFGSYPDGPPEEALARLQLAVPRSGLRLMTTIVAIFTAIVFGLEQILPGARATLMKDTGGAVAILLAAPAIVVALLARPGENAIAAALLLPLRVVVLVCAGLLGAGAASFVGRLHTPYMGVLWTLGAWVSLIVALVLVITTLVSGTE